MGQYGHVPSLAFFESITTFPLTNKIPQIRNPEWK